MKSKIILISSLMFGSLMLGACTVQDIAPPSTPTPPAATIDSVDSAIDNQDLDADFPDLTQSDLEK